MTSDLNQERPAALDRIKQMCQRMAMLEGEREWRHPFRLNPCIAEPALASWEQANEVRLPNEYRLFLLEVGNGGVMPGPYCDFELWPRDPESLYDLDVPFPISRKQLRDRMAQARAAGSVYADVLFPELTESLDEGVPAGCLPVGRYPSYDLVFLVVRGELRGTVWCAVNSGVPEFDRQGIPFDFLGWLEDTFLEAKQW